MIWAWLQVLWGCSTPPPETPKPVFLQLDMLDLEEEVSIPEIGVRVKILRMTTATLNGGGHRAHATVRLVWDDGVTEIHEDDLGLIFHSRGYRFWVDGMHDMASIDVRGPVTTPVPGAAPGP